MTSPRIPEPGFSSPPSGAGWRRGCTARRHGVLLKREGRDRYPRISQRAAAGPGLTRTRRLGRMSRLAGSGTGAGATCSGRGRYQERLLAGRLAPAGTRPINGGTARPCPRGGKRARGRRRVRKLYGGVAWRKNDTRNPASPCMRSRTAIQPKDSPEVPPEPEDGPGVSAGGGRWISAPAEGGGRFATPVAAG